MTGPGSLCRSWLFVPGDSPRKIARAWSSGADAVVLDLEDAVAPAQKAPSRAGVADAIAGARGAGTAPAIFVRVNALGSGLALDDVRGTFESRPDGYVLPKIEDVAEIAAVSALLADLERAHGLAPGATALVPIVTETPLAVFRLPDLCRADPRLTAVIWGAEDLSTALGASRTRNADGTWLDVFRTVRSLVLLAAAGAGLGIVDAPFTDLDDLAALGRESREAAVMGFTGKLALHPAQVPPVNRGFSPDAEEVARARELLDMARSTGAGVFRFHGQMVDRPHLNAAERILARAAAQPPEA